VPAENVMLDEALHARISRALRSQLSPRHVPDRLLSVPDIPRTLTGKKLEVPVKRIMRGEPAERLTSRDSLANPEALDAFVALAGG
jgi:acetoacetyl-CoA synthetase